MAPSLELMASLSGIMSANCNHTLSTARSIHNTKRQDLILLNINATPTPGVCTVTTIHRYHYGRKLNLCRWWRHLTELFVYSLTAVRPVVQKLLAKDLPIAFVELGEV